MQKTITLEQVGKWSTNLSTNIGPCPSQRELLHHLFDVVRERDGVTPTPLVLAPPISESPAGAGGRCIQLKPGNPLLLVEGGAAEAFRVGYGLGTDEMAALNIVIESRDDGSVWVFEKAASAAQE
jgi:hypothetical protein